MRHSAPPEFGWPPRTSADHFGPQGSALILELRRLQAALAQADDEPREPHPNRDRHGHERAARPAARRPAEPRQGRKRRKGAARRALERLQKLWFGNRSRTEPALPPAASDPPRRDRHEPREPPAPRQPMPRAEPRRETPHETRHEHSLFSNFGLQDGLRISLPERETRPPAEAAAPVRHAEGVGRALAIGKQHARAAWDFLVAGARGGSVEAAPDAELAARVGHAFEGELRTGLRVLIASVGILGGWATLVPLSGAVVAPGALVVQSKVKKVQHPTGGVVAQISVHDGAHVAAGDLVVHLDETQARANQQMLSNQLAQARARIARLTAERDGADEIKSPQSDPQLLTSEKSQFNARSAARKSQKELLRSRISQLGEQIAGFEAQIKSKASQLELIGGEQQGVQGLYDKGLVTLTRLTTLQREAARLDGERSQLVSAIAEAKAKISESEIQILRIDQDFRTEVTKELRESTDKEAELSERTVAAEDLLNRIDIRAPATGIVNQLSVHTIGGVVAPGEVIMEIVPDTDELEIEARLPPQDIDQVRRGQTTYVRLSAFNQRTTPQLKGFVSYVSADLTHDKQSNASYYTVRVTLPGEERHRLNDLQLMSGMPAEVFFQTGSRSMMSYLFKPITDQFQRMFTER
jgi:HlyD family secretion protein